MASGNKRKLEKDETSFEEYSDVERMGETSKDETSFEEYTDVERIGKTSKVENISEEDSDIESTDEDSEMTYYLCFENLPDTALIHILGFLDFKDRCSAAYVCRRWYEISRTPVVWAKVDLKVESSLHLLKSLLKLPRAVTYLDIYCKTFDRHSSLWLPDILTRLHKQCPGIKTLIIENVFFSRRFCNVRFTTDHVLMHSFETEKSESSKPKKCSPDVARCKNICCSDKIKRDKYIPKYHPQELSIISLRYARSYISHLSSYISQFFPKTKVLDLTCSAAIKSSAVLFFLNLKYLEELYLVECTVTNFALESLLKKLKTLKVLDLECSVGTDNETYSILKEHGSSLEKLFLGNTCINSFPTDDDSFPKLKQICLRNTFIDDENLSFFMLHLPNLKYIDASFCELVTMDAIAFQVGVYEKEFIYTNEGDPKKPCHHFKKKFM